MQTFIIEWENTTRDGRCRTYHRAVETNDIPATIAKMKLSLYGRYAGTKGIFRRATEVIPVKRFGYKYKNFYGGQYYFVRGWQLDQGTVTWDTWYDYSLKGWLR